MKKDIVKSHLKKKSQAKLALSISLFIVLLTATGYLFNSKEDFINWTKSEAFKLAHKNAGQHKDLYLGAPNFEGFEVVL